MSLVCVVSVVVVFSGCLFVMIVVALLCGCAVVLLVCCLAVLIC